MLASPRRIAALTISVSLLLATPAGGPLAEASFPGANGKLAFSAIPQGQSDRELFLANADGSNPQQLTFNTSNEDDPSWSPDGSMIAYTSDATGGGDIYTIRVDGTDVRQVTFAARPEFQPSFSPFGNRIAYVMFRQNGAELYTVGTDGTGVFRLTRTNRPESNPDWSPLGTEIAFDSASDGTQGIFAISPNGTGLRLIATKANAAVGDPSWAPNGKRLAVSRFDTGDPGANIWSVRQNGGGWTRWTKRPSVEVRPAWAPDGESIAFLEVDDGDRRLRAVKTDGTTTTLIAGGVIEPDDPAWQRVPA